MLKTRVMPCLLLKNQGLVKTVRFKNPAYVGDPINTIRIYNEKEVDELILLDISATVENKKPNFKIISEVASECFMPLTYGGGIRCIEDARNIFNLGVEKIVINTCAVENPDFIRLLADSFGSQSIVVAIDALKISKNDYEIYIYSGKHAAKNRPVEFAVLMEKLGAGEILLNSIDRDGTFSGYDLELIRAVTDAISIPVIASGGACRIEDFLPAVKYAGASALAAGSMFVYQGENRSVLINFPSREELKSVLP